MFTIMLLPFLLFVSPAFAQSAVVTLDSATVIGTVSEGGVHQYLGIPFAKPPIGDLRFNLPVAVDAYTGSVNATAFGPACPQQGGTAINITGLPLETIELVAAAFKTLVGEEDCLSLNVVTPNVTITTPLPVVAWIFGGGYELGGTEAYDGSVIVERSIAMGQPIIFVSMNYRLSAYGFLPGKEVKDAGVGNLGLLDQRLALRWIQKYIDVFGGDPTKVTIWGESAGAMSVSFQMLMNGGDTEGLFRGAFMQSGSPNPTGSIENGQEFYDAIVDNTGCAHSNDTLHCLRGVPYDTLKTAIDEHTPDIFDYQSLRIAYLPRADGLVLPQNPQHLIAQGKFANIPVVSGECDDEGTVFSLSQRNVSTDADFKAYLQYTLLPQVPVSDIDILVELYPSAPSVGSPFDTGDENILTPQFKRIASFLGDFVFQAPRRFFLSALAEKKQRDIYTYISKREKSLPYLGSFHGSDTSLNTFYPGGDMQDYLIRFVVSLNPNGDGAEPAVAWPRWSPKSPKMLSFNDGDVPLNITEDAYRKKPMDVVSKVLYKYPV